MATYNLNPEDIVQITMVQQYQGQVLMNVWHYQYLTTQPSVPDGRPVIESLMNKFEDTWYNVAGGVQDLQNVNLSNDKLRGQIIYPNRQFYTDHLPAQPAGTYAVGSDCPSDLQWCYTLQSQAPGRGKAGRKNFGGMSDGMYTNNQLTGAFHALIATNLSGASVAVLTTTVGARIFKPVIWSPSHPNSPSDIALGFAQREVRVMRRRQFRLGI